MTPARPTGTATVSPTTATTALRSNNDDQADRRRRRHGRRLRADGDGDGVVDDTDNCDGMAKNGDQADSDGDGRRRLRRLDGDGDGVPDDTDNCPNAANPGQRTATPTAPATPATRRRSGSSRRPARTRASTTAGAATPTARASPSRTRAPVSATRPSTPPPRRSGRLRQGWDRQREGQLPDGVQPQPAGHRSGRRRRCLRPDAHRDQAAAAQGRVQARRLAPLHRRQGKAVHEPGRLRQLRDQDPRRSRDHATTGRRGGRSDPRGDRSRARPVRGRR